MYSKNAKILVLRHLLHAVISNAEQDRTDGLFYVRIGKDETPLNEDDLAIIDEILDDLA